MSQEIYKIGGSLTANHPSYVKREADDELFNNLVKGEYCYVLNSRQMGKSSLAVQTRSRLLETEQFIAPIIDLSGIAKDCKREQWYLAVATIMMEYITIANFNWTDYWHSFPLDPKDRLGELIKQILKITEKNLVIFLDEIDSVRLLKNFDTDDLFTYIRSCLNYRATIDLFNRLTFCLIGVKTPNDFIQDKGITSFNIGKSIELKGFTVEEAEPLRIGLQLKFADKSQEILKTIIEKWTNGQPFLTQKMCTIALEHADSKDPDIDLLVNEYVIKDWASQDNPTHLAYIRDRILDDKQEAVRLLTIYKEILQQGQIEANDSKEHTELRLSGLVIRQGGYLQPFNRIYQEVFNQNWVNQQLAEIRPYAARFNAWLTAKEELKQRYLLYGKELEQALEWAKNNNLSNEDHTFLTRSEVFDQGVRGCFYRGIDYQGIIYALLSWTGGGKFLNDFIFKIARNTFRKAIKKGEEEAKFEIKLIPKIKKDKDLQQHCNEISDRLFDDHNIDPFLLLSSYQAILEKDEVEFNDSPEHQKLIDMCLGVKEDGKLRIVGKIYRLIFDQKWVEEQLSRLCPYAKEFQAWQASGCQDESLLLKGEDLQKALDWIQKKDKLSELELEFIITSLVWEIWQSDSKEEKKEAVAIIQKFLPQLKETPNYSYGLIQEILKYTRHEPFLLEGCFKLIVQNDYLVEDIEKFVTSKKKTDDLIEFFKNQLLEATDNSYGIDSMFLLDINSNYILSSYLVKNDTQSLYLNKIVEIGLHNINNLLNETQTLSEELRIKHINLFTEDGKIIYFAVLSGQVLICVVVDIQKNQIYLNLQEIIKYNQDKISDLLTL
ncbi:AAA-like domain-containing protein [Planktothricoides raciborskii]|uniref:AAA-like domain-containing protein n=1 Tax=Planktothricoides raciborskii FACHB-1370 TaxID=2949576 RepID=A0ABR8EC71_9CYAN|nr:AAA-like domain-containing protein [Planktothricoides raciborskii]MBD2543912.1 AAA-like domain-containing protein [Planktothricoides raciborskii FACHB-1370]MBD2582899.1 AAA-like domain-containing protein [Planktothricoides raciborskii FACHB-1261]